MSGYVLLRGERVVLRVPRATADPDGCVGAPTTKAAAIVNNYCDLDGSLSPAQVDAYNAEREEKRQALRAEAARIREEAGI